MNMTAAWNLLLAYWFNDDNLQIFEAWYMTVGMETDHNIPADSVLNWK